MRETTVQLTVVNGQLETSPTVLPEGLSIAVSTDRVVIIVAPYSQATIVHTFMNTDANEGSTHLVTDIELGKGAALTIFTIERQSSTSHYRHRRTIRQDADSRFTGYHYTLGAQRARQDDVISLNAPGASAALYGLYVGHDTQELVHDVRIDHFAPHCTSRTLYKGILDHRSKGVFNGKVIVHPHAQKTDASQTIKNLLLSDDAEADPTPQLEIFADDVKCSHGATVGQLDPTALFYLQSRGIDEAEAKRLLTYAFASELVAVIENDPLRADVDHWVKRALTADEEVSCLG